MYCARLRRAEASRAPTRTALWAENPPPSQHLLDEGRRDQAFPAQQGKHFRPEPWLEHFARNGRQHGESAVGIESTVRRKHMDMRVEVDEIAEGLDEEDHPRSRAGPGSSIGADEQAFDDVAQLAQQCAPAGENRAAAGAAG